MKKFHFFKKKKSSDIAKDRLKILLISDRINCSPQTLNLIKVEIIKSISKYMSIDEEHMEIVLKRNNKRGMCCLLNGGTFRLFRERSRFEV